MNQLLTDEEIREISIDCASVSHSDIYFARVIEAKILKILNSAQPIYQLRPDCENWIDCTEKFYGDWRGDKRMLFTHPPAPSAVEWISVSDRLPESANLKDFYMAYTKSEGVLLLAGWFIGHEECTATHWALLPQAPKEES